MVAPDINYNYSFSSVPLFYLQQQSYRSKLKLLVSKIANCNSVDEKKGNNNDEQKEVTSIRRLVTSTVLAWTQESNIKSPGLVREIFSLLYRQYNGIGEVTMRGQSSNCCSNCMNSLSQKR